MNRLCIVFVALTIAVVSLTAQVKTVHFKKLQECFPAKPLVGFVQEKPTGSTQTSMGMSTSEVRVEYRAVPKDTTAQEQTEPVIRIELKISDMVMMPYALMQFSMQQDYENETEDSYEKSLKVAGKYPGREEIRKGESKSCRLMFAVANRFLVEAQADGTDDIKLLETALNAMDLARLENFATQP